MEIFFTICAGRNGHYIYCYDQDCVCADALARHAHPISWINPIAAEEFALERGWHPATGEMLEQLHRSPDSKPNR